MGNHTTIRDYPIDTSLFSPVQFQVRSILSLAMNNTWEWLSEAGVSFPRFIKEFKQGLVVAFVDISYLAPFKFLDSDRFFVHTKPGRIRRQGTFLEGCIDFVAQQTVFARLHVRSAVLKLSGDEAMGGVPGALAPPLLALFSENDDANEPIKMPLPALLKDISDKPAVAEGRHSFRVYRHQCEVADQWCFIELAGWAEEARHNMVMNSTINGLKKSFKQPMKRYITKYARPLFFMDEGEILSKAYLADDRLIFVHEVMNAAQKVRCATVVEEF